MKKNEVHVGQSYMARVSGRLVEVRIVRESSRTVWGSSGRPDRVLTCWVGVNLKTGREIRIASAQRLRLIVSNGATAA
jgi:hypothetical protein